MITKKLRLIEEDTFEHGFRLQWEWAWLITTAFFLGEVGAGLFLVSLFLSGKISLAGSIGGWIIVTVGKNSAHMLYLGRPLRFWRMIMRPGTSWITRGFYATIALMIFGALHIYFSFQGVDSPVCNVITWIAGFSAFVVMIYDAIVMTYSPSLSLWNNPLLPILRASYALMGGVTITIFISSLEAFHGILNLGQMNILENLERGLIIANLLMIVIYVLTMTYSTIESRESVLLMLRDKYPVVFWLGAVFIGLIVIFLIPIVVTTHSLPFLLFVAICELVGDYCILFLLMRSGVYSPLMPHPNIDPALFARGKA